jgi:DNA-binding NarL/FixJ family response regulator
MKIILVDDHALFRVGARLVLGSTPGFEIAGEASTARRGLELVLIDIGLPGMDGYALAAALRHGGLVGATLVAVTGYGRAEDVSRSRRAGFGHHLVKPVDLAALLSITAAT